MTSPCKIVSPVTFKLDLKVAASSTVKVEFKVVAPPTVRVLPVVTAPVKTDVPVTAKELSKDAPFLTCKVPPKIVGLSSATVNE